MSSNGEESPEQVGARIAEIHRLRGQLISDLNGVEALLDQGIAAYFGRPLNDFVFQSWVLGRISMSSKIDLVEQIVRDCGLQHKLGTTVTELRRLNEYRNGLAHSHVTTGAIPAGKETLDYEDFLSMLRNVTAYRSGRRGRIAEVVDEGELNEKLELLAKVETMSLRFMMAVALRDGEGGAVEAFERIDASNPDLPRL